LWNCFKISRDTVVSRDKFTILYIYIYIYIYIIKTNFVIAYRASADVRAWI